jgi:hypothetical protein
MMFTQTVFLGSGWASKDEIVITLSSDPYVGTPVCKKEGVNCQIKFYAQAGDPEEKENCSDGKPHTNPVKLWWQFDGGDWIEEEEEGYSFDITKEFTTLGRHTLVVKADDASEPIFDCDENDDPAYKNIAFYIYELNKVLVREPGGLSLP